MRASVVFLFVLVNVAFASPIKTEPQSKDFWNQISQQLNDALYPIVNQAVQDLALQITQNLADFANGGTLFGKRSAEDQKNFWNQISQQLNDALYPIVNQAVQDLALQITQNLADFANGGTLFGKRSAEDQRFWNTLQDLINQAIKPAIDNSAQGIAALLAQITAGVAIDGIPAISDLIGKRDTEAHQRLSNFLQDYINQAIKPAIDNSAQNIAALLAQITAGVAIDGIPAITDLIG